MKTSNYLYTQKHHLDRIIKSFSIALTSSKSRLILILMVAFFSSNLVSAQKKLKKAISQAEEFIARDDFKTAASILKNYENIEPTNGLLNLRLGYCYLNMDSTTELSISLLQQAVASFPLKKKKNDYAFQARFYLGQAYHTNYRFKEALNEFQALESKIPPKSKDLLASVQKELNYAKNAIKLSENPVNFKITNLGSGINTNFDEYSPVVSAVETQLIFTSNRKGTGDYMTPDSLYFEDIYISKLWNNEWSKAEPIGYKINTEGNNASISISADMRTLFIYEYDGISGDLYYSNLNFDGWSTPEKLPRPINSTYSETHASMSIDSNTLYFTSDRPGGYGGYDIYATHKLPTGEWGKEINLGPVINTIGDEESPFIHADGKTLYFCSTNHTSMGGFDIFKSTQNDSAQWSEPVNIGYPINTPDDDLFYIPTVDGQRVYFASRRQGGFGRSDLYLIEFSDNDPRSLAVIAGYVFDNEKQPYSEAIITLSDKETGDVIGIYRANPSTGKFIAIAPSGKSYTISYESDKETITKDIQIPNRANFTSGNWAFYIDPVFISR